MRQVYFSSFSECFQNVCDLPFVLCTKASCLNSTKAAAYVGADHAKCFLYRNNEQTIPPHQFHWLYTRIVDSSHQLVMPILDISIHICMQVIPNNLMQLHLTSMDWDKAALQVDSWIDMKAQGTAYSNGHIVLK